MVIIDKIKIDIEKYLKELNFIIADKEKRKLDFPTEWAFYYIMERYHINLSVINDLIVNLDKNDLIDIPIGLILRASLLDSLISFDLLYFSENKEDLEGKIQKYLIDNNINTYGYFQELKKYGIVQSEDFISARENMERSIKILIDHMGIKDIEELISRENDYKPPSPKAIFKKLINSKYKYLSGCFDCYNYYSKYEHFGILYPMISRQDNTQKNNIVKTSLEYIFMIIDILKDTEMRGINH
jgi:hypothetical protein